MQWDFLLQRAVSFTCQMSLSIKILTFGSNLPRVVVARKLEFISAVCSSENRMALSGQQTTLAAQESRISKIGVHFLGCTFLMFGPIIKIIGRQSWSILLADENPKFTLLTTGICSRDHSGSSQSV